jgi:glycosyltransferase involved in cell wall biosynthesis
LVKRPSDNQPQSWPGVSVIITARNEAHNLEKFLPYVLTQDYPQYQVVVVNHASTDGSEYVLKRFEHQYSNLYVTTIPYSPASQHTKKLALTIGHKAARYDILLFTDADCKPVSKNWIKNMVRNFDQKTQIVLGYGGYKKQKGLLDKWLRTDTTFIAMQYFGFALRGLPYMGVGRNIAWRKSFFDQRGGYTSHFYEPSGSDDIFVNQNATRDNTKCEFSPESFTESVPPRSWKEFILMKKRHFGSTRFYKLKYKIWLLIEPLSRILFFSSVIAFMVLKTFNLFVIFIFFARELTINLIFGLSAAKLKETNLWWFYWLYDKLQPLFNLFLYLSKKQQSRWM